MYYNIAIMYYIMYYTINNYTITIMYHIMSWATGLIQYSKVKLCDLGYHIT